MKAIKAIAWALVWFVLCACMLWAAGALYFDFPVSILRGPAALLLLLAFVATAIFVSGKLLKLAICLGGFALVTGWWLTLSPTNDSDWQPDMAQKAWADVQGDEVTLHNVRNCDYRTEIDYTPHWETRTVRISQISGIDLAVDYWGSPWIAHPIASFQFADAPPLCFSIETRKKLGHNIALS